MTDWGLFWLYAAFVVMLSVTGYLWNAIEHYWSIKRKVD